MADDARWLLLIVSLPGAATSRARVGTWRKLKRSGALAIKDSVYLLPATDDATELANWLAAEIRSVGGEASIARTASLSGLDDAALVKQFQALRDPDYEEIEAALAPLVKAATRRDEAARARLEAELRRASQRLDEVARIDFFKAPAGVRARELRDRGRLLVETGRAHAPPATPALDRSEYRGRVWATRARPKVDRLSSAWLIRRFIDPAARFAFFDGGETPPHGSVTFDTYGGAFTHEGEDCTFEVLARRFGIEDQGVRALAEVIHDADLEDGKFGRAEHAGLNAVVRGLLATNPDDQALVAAAEPVFDALRAALVADEPARSEAPVHSSRAGPPRRSKKKA